MSRFFRNVLIIGVCNFAALIIVSNITSVDWKLQIMFLWGLISGAIISVFDEEEILNK